MLPYQILYKRIRLIRILLPLLVIGLVSAYVFGPARWIHNALGLEYHLMAELVIFGSLGPLFAFILLDLVARWMEERQTSDLQAKVLEETRLEVYHNRILSDDALQAIFAASIQLDSLRKHTPDLSPEACRAVEEANRALYRAIKPLRSHLEKPSTGKQINSVALKLTRTGDLPVGDK